MTIGDRREGRAISESLAVFALEAVRIRREFCANTGLERSDALALALLHRYGRMRIAEVGRSLALSSGAATMLTDRLELREFVQRLGDPLDRRIKIVTLTAKGERWAQAPEGPGLVEGALTNFTATEIATCERVLDEVAERARRHHPRPIVI